MEKEKRRDLKIYGSGISNGGEFDKISIMGEGIIHGDVKCTNPKIYGEGQLDGNVKSADYISIKGETIVKGDLNAIKVKVQGDLKSTGIYLWIKPTFREICWPAVIVMLKSLT